ncbi:MAG: tetratricopeptide repeat protein [Candidatus Zixiibacteriota bacterium]
MVRYIGTIFLLVLMLGLPAKIQAQAEQRLDNPPVEVRGLSENERQLAFARNLIRLRNFEGASALLEVLYEKEPENEIVQHLLKQCYEELKYYDKSEVLLRKFIENHPGNIGYYLNLAEILIIKGELDEGYQYYDRAVELIKVDDTNRYLLVVSSLISSGLDDRALRLIDSLRLVRSDSSLFALERGQVFEKRKEYRVAAQEYFPLLFEDTTNSAVNAERRLLEMLEFPESSGEVEKTLLDQTRQATNERALKLLSTFYIKSGQYDRAYEFTIREDSLAGKEGKALVYFMRQCRERKVYEQVNRMGAYILEHYDETSPLFLEAAYNYGEALEKTGQYHKAIDVYNRIFASAQRDREKAEALYYIGAVYLNNLYRYDSALTCFDSVIARYRSGMGYINALRLKPKCYIRLGELDRARSVLQDLSRNRFNEDFHEEVFYNLALVSFFEGQFDSASIALHKLIVDYPRGFYVNDALQLLLVIDEAGENKPVMENFSRALWYLERRMPDSTRVRFNEIADAPGGLLADIALYRLAGLDLNEADTLSALGHIDRLISGYPDSYYLPFGMKMKADIYLLNKDKVEEAKAIYRQILENYGTYPFISEIREKLRRLEADIT